MAEKVTIMILKVVDLQCYCCYKKIKKILCKFPQIRDQIYDEKANTVTITVVCCDPEKFRDKLCCKGGKVIKSIEIKEPPKPKEPEKPKEPVKPKEPEKPIVVVEKPKQPEKPKVIVVEKPKEPEKPKVAAPKEPEKPKPTGPPPKDPKPDPPKIPQPVPNPPVVPEPVISHGPPPLYPFPTCCGQCYGGYDGGPCRLGYGVPPPPVPRFEGYSGYGCGHGCGYGFGRDCHHFSRGDYYPSEENPSSCSIM